MKGEKNFDPLVHIPNAQDRDTPNTGAQKSILAIPCHLPNGTLAGNWKKGVELELKVRHSDMNVGVPGHVKHLPLFSLSIRIMHFEAKNLKPRPYLKKKIERNKV